MIILLKHVNILWCVCSTTNHVPHKRVILDAQLSKVAISWDNKMDFNLCANMAISCSDSHIHISTYRTSGLAAKKV